MQFVVDLCNENSPMAPSTVSVLAGTDVSIYCALPDSTVTWSSAQFGVSATSIFQKKANLGPDIRLRFIGVNYSTQPPCANASAMIQNISKSLDGLNITCRANNLAETSHVFVITVIGKTYKTTTMRVCPFNYIATLDKLF